MPRYRLYPTPEQETVLREHCAHARYVWNLCVEQQSWWRPGRKSAPGWAVQSRQLTEARAEFDWLRAGSREIQQHALLDYRNTMRSFHDGRCARPSWRKAGRSDGFRNADKVNTRRLSRHVGEVQIPKLGWVRFRWSRAVPVGVKSYRVTLDRAGRWHIAFVAIPAPVMAPGNGEIIGIDRGVAISAALSTGEMLTAPRLGPQRTTRLKRLQRKLARAKRGSNRRKHVKAQIARLKTREADARKDWCEKLSTDLATRFDLIRVEDLKIRNMTRSAKGTIAEPGRNVRQKAGLNREITRSGWGLLVRRLEDKAPGRVEKVPAAYTSQRCSACGHIAKESRESQSRFRCVACKFACNADVNAAINIAAGHAVNARGADLVTGALMREPDLALTA